MFKNSEKRTTGKKPKKLENLKIEIARFDEILRITPKNEVSSFLNEKIEDIEIKSKPVTPKSSVKPSEEKLSKKEDSISMSQKRRQKVQSA